MDGLLWAMALLGLGVFLLGLEIFVPSGGVLAFFSACAMLGAIAVGFMESFRIGMAVTLLMLVVLPACLALAVKLWPKTPIGRRMIVQAPTTDELLPPAADRERRQALLGKIGVAATKMLPSGEVLIDGQAFDAVTSGMAVDPGQVIEVVDVTANRIVVKPTTRTLDESSLHTDGTGPAFEDLSFDSLEG